PSAALSGRAWLWSRLRGRSVLSEPGARSLAIVSPPHGFTLDDRYIGSEVGFGHQLAQLLVFAAGSPDDMRHPDRRAVFGSQECRQQRDVSDVAAGQAELA